MECIFAHPSLSIFEWCDLVRVKSTVEISQTFVAFSEYMNCIKERIESINCWGYSDRKFGLNALAQRFENNDIATPISIYSCHTYKTVLQYTQLQYDFM